MKKITSIILISSIIFVILGVTYFISKERSDLDQANFLTQSKGNPKNEIPKEGKDNKNDILECTKFENENACLSGKSKDTCVWTNNRCEKMCLASQEICDGKDNDCDNTIDEDLTISENCVEGIGACAVTGTISTSCLNGTMTQGTCNAIPNEPNKEICDEIDNDCNGEIDNGLQCQNGGGNKDCGQYPTQQACTNGNSKEGCERNGEKCLTKQTCIDTDTDSICDEIDNCVSIANIDQIDKDINGIGDDCEVIEECIKSNEGIEICDDQDNDCDGLYDEELSCNTNVEGYCGDGIRENEEQCDDGNNDTSDFCTNECITNSPLTNSGSKTPGNSGLQLSNNGNGGGQISSKSALGNTGNTINLEKKLDGNVPTKATTMTVIQACEEETYILMRLEKLSTLSVEIVEAIPSKYAQKIGVQAIKLNNKLITQLRKTSDSKLKNNYIKNLVCKIEMIKEGRGLKHQNIGAIVNANEIDYLLQYIQDSAILQFTR